MSDYGIESLWGIYSAVAVIALLVIEFFVRPPTKRSYTQLFTQVLIIICLGIAASGLYREVPQVELPIPVYVDLSASVDEGVGTQLIEKLNAFRDAGIDLTLFPFGGEVSSAGVVSSESYAALRRGWGRVDQGNTDLGRAIQRAVAGGEPALFTTDGWPTQGAIDAPLQAATGQGVKIYPLVLDNSVSIKGAFRIVQLSSPLVAPAQKSVDIRVAIENTTDQPQTGILKVLHDSKVVLEKRIDVAARQEQLQIATSDPAAEGIKEITATLTPIERGFTPSSETVFLSGEEREKVLLVSGDAQDARYLAELLQDQRYKLTSIIVGDNQQSLPDLKSFSAVVFNNVARSQLSGSTPNTIEQYVKEGGGFIMIGGNRSFGLGGYIDSAIERILPVQMVPPQTMKKRLNVAVQLVIDKSRSMSFDDKLEYAKEAARETVRNLKDDDYVGVIGFDAAPFSVFPIERLATGRDRALSRIGQLFATGKTYLLPALDEARRGLMKVDAGRKHMIVLTDGQLPDAGPVYLSLIKELRMLGITVSTIMLGGESDIEFLKSLAELGGGAFYQTLDARNLPRIFLSDIRVSSGERTLQEDQEYAVRAGPDGVRSVTVQGMPPLRGYVQTKPRNGADLELVVLGNDKAEPLLASWMVGEGRSLAFTSDANGRWSNYWVRWPRFQTFWSEALDSVRPKDAQSENIRFDLRTAVEHGALLLDLAVYDPRAAGTAQVALTSPDGTTRTVALQQSSPGRFIAKIDRATAGTYRAQFKVGQFALTPVAWRLSGELFGERRGNGFNQPLLERIASETGAMLNPTPADLRALKRDRTQRESLSFWLAVLAAAALLINVLLREGVVRIGTMGRR